MRHGWSILCHRSNWMPKFPKRATSARWRRGNASAPMQPVWPWIPRASRATGKILAQTDMVVAAGGGERDLDVDAAILTARADARSGALNERLMNDLRPTLFLAQLSNLLAGNISIVHGVSGSSRTFMGEEAAGVDAVRIAWARIASAQSEIALVGAAHNGERKEMLMLYECGGFNLKTDFASVWARNGAGFALGSGGVFLVLESKTHAERRGAKPFARLGSTSCPVIPPDLPPAQ